MKPSEKTIATVLLAIMFMGLLTSMTSCASNRDGYGCTGRSKSITGFKQNKYGGFSGRHQGLTRRERRGY
jgi:hypothetical protein